MAVFGAMARGVSATYARLLDDDVFVLAAAIAFSAVLSLFPLLIGLVALLGWLVGQAEAQRAVVDALRPYLPPGVLSQVWAILAAAIRARGPAGVVAIIGLFWTASSAASVLRHSLNRVLRVRQARPFWRRKLVELLMVSLGGALISLSVVVSAVTAVIDAVPAVATALQWLREIWLYPVLTAVAPWILSTAAFVILYRFLPNTRVRWRSVLLGSVAGVLLFEATKRAFFGYLRTVADYPLVYSHLAGVVVFMVWSYLVALVLLVGAEVIARAEGI